MRADGGPGGTGPRNPAAALVAIGAALVAIGSALSAVHLSVQWAPLMLIGAGVAVLIVALVRSVQARRGGNG